MDIVERPSSPYRFRGTCTVLTEDDSLVVNEVALQGDIHPK